MNLTATSSAFVCFPLFCFVFFLRYVYKWVYVAVQTSLREELHVNMRLINLYHSHFHWLHSIGLFDPILSKCERSKNASRAKKINTSQDLSRLNVRRIIILLPTLVIINIKLMEKSWSCSIIRKFVSFWSYINNCDRHFSWKMCSKPLKKH